MNTSEEPPGGEKKNGATVYIANMSEDVWPFISSITDKRHYEFEIQDNANLADRDLFTLLPNGGTLCILPKLVSDDFISYYSEIIGNKKVKVIAPKIHSGVICDDILHDELIMKEIINCANSSSKLTMIAYTTSMQFLALVDELRSRGLTIFTPESPEEEDAWTVNFFGSKSGARQLAQKSGAVEPDFRMAEGVICVGTDDAARIAATKYLKDDGVVLKTNKGHSGSGVLLFRSGELPKTYRACEKEIKRILSREAYWDRFPIIIEDFIQTTASIGGGFPNVEFKIHKNGKVEFLYYCGMRMTKGGSFRGIEIDNDVVSDKVAAQMVDTGFYIGEQYSHAGYRGYFDVDFIAGRNGQLYVTESNVRRTGGTHVYQTAIRLFGPEFMYDTYVLSNNTYQLPERKKFKFTELLELMKPILFNRKTKEGMILVSENMLLEQQMQYIIFGKTQKRAEAIEASMDELLKKTV